MNFNKDKRVYQVIHNNGYLELIAGADNLPPQNTVKSVRRVRYPSKNIAFFDAEYTCPVVKGARPAELLSVGIIICNKNFQIQEQYSSNIHPEHQAELTDYCRELTGLKQEDIDAAPTYETVMEQMIDLIDKYDIETILVWGSDKAVLKKDLETNHSEISSDLRLKCEDMDFHLNRE